jgi:phosphomannomutase
VHAFDEPVPTPLLAFSVLATGAAAGVMITASHNPAAYNGYKIYWQEGAQLNTPNDSAIAQRIERGPGMRELPRVSRAEAESRGTWHSLQELPQRYLAALQQRLNGPFDAQPPRVAYSALHGVGEPLARAALQLAGVDDLASVAEQALPNPDFPTVRFPNPEEPGALDRLLELARDTRADLALANDPDADRLAAAVPGPDGEPRVLSGNELGALLCDYLLAQAPPSATHKPLIVTTIVTSPFAERIARARGAQVDVTLTGFKWILARALEREAQGLQFVLGFEEALGYCVGDLVRDKDGIAAAAHVAQMARWHAANGCSLWRALETLYVRHGLWKSRQVSIALSDHEQAQQVQKLLTQLRRNPPSQIAGLPVSSLHDLLYGPNPTGLPASDVFIFQLEGGQRITIRPSGTEPKLKLYLDCTRAVASREELPAAHQKLEVVLDRFEQVLRGLLLPTA